MGPLGADYIRLVHAGGLPDGANALIKREDTGCLCVCMHEGSPDENVNRKRTLAKNPTMLAPPSQT